MGDTPAILLPHTITDDNKYADFTYGSADFTATLSTGEYASIITLCTELQSSMGTAASTSDFTVSAAVTSGILKTTITCNSAVTFSLLLDTGTHGESGSGDFCWARFGFETGADDTGSTSYTSDYQALGCWVSSRPPTGGDDYDMSEFIGSDKAVALDGTYSETLEVAVQNTRKIEFDYLPPEIVFDAAATGANNNRDFQTFWESWIGGDVARYYPDRDSLVAYSKYYLEGPELWKGVVPRVSSDTAVWGFTLEMRKQEV